MAAVEKEKKAIESSLLGWVGARARAASGPLFFLFRAVQRCDRVIRRAWPSPWALSLPYACAVVVVARTTHQSLSGLAAADAHVGAWYLGGAFVVLTIPLAVALSVAHLNNFVEPGRQAQTVRIIWTVPV